MFFLPFDAVICVVDTDFDRLQEVSPDAGGISSSPYGADESIASFEVDFA